MAFAISQWMSFPDGERKFFGGFKQNSSKNPYLCRRNEKNADYTDDEAA